MPWSYPQVEKDEGRRPGPFEKKRVPVPCGKHTAKAPENRPGPKRKLILQPSVFRGELLVSERVIVVSPYSLKKKHGSSMEFKTSNSLSGLVRCDGMKIW